MLLNNIHLSRTIAIFAVNKLAEVDYTIANKVSHDAANIITWSYNHNFPFLSNITINILQNLDNFGSILISFVVWLVHNTY